MSILADGFSRYLNNTINYDRLYAFYKQIFNDAFDNLLARPKFIDCAVGEDLENFPKYPDYFNMFPDISKFNLNEIYESAADQVDELKNLITDGLVLQRRPAFEAIAKDGFQLYYDLLVQYSYVRDMDELFPEEIFYRPFRTDTAYRNFVSLVQGDTFTGTNFGSLSPSLVIDLEKSSAIHLWLLFSALGQTLPNLTDLVDRSIEWMLFIDQNFVKINTEITSPIPEDGTTTDRGYHIETGINDIFVFSFDSGEDSPYPGETDVTATLTPSGVATSPNTWTSAATIAADIQAAYDAAVLASPGVYPPATIAFDKSGFIQIIAPSGFTQIFIKTSSTGARTLGFSESNAVPVAEGLIADTTIEYTFTNGANIVTAANTISADQIPVDHRIVYDGDTDNFAVRVLRRNGLIFTLDRDYQGAGGTGNVRIGSPYNASHDTMRVDFNNFIADNFADMAKDLSNLVTKAHYDFVKPSEYLLNDIVAVALESKIQEMAEDFAEYVSVLQPSPVSRVCNNIHDSIVTTMAGDILYRIHDSFTLYPIAGTKRQHFDLGEATRWQNDPSQWATGATTLTYLDMADSLGEDPNTTAFKNKVTRSKIKDYILLVLQYKFWPYKFINTLPLSMIHYTQDKIKTADDLGWSEVQIAGTNSFVKAESDQTDENTFVDLVHQYLKVPPQISPNPSPNNDGLIVYRDIYNGTDIFNLATTKYYIELFDQFMDRDAFHDYALELQKVIFESIRDYGLVPYNFEWSECVELVEIYLKSYIRKHIMQPELASSTAGGYIMQDTQNNLKISYDQVINNNTGDPDYDVTFTHMVPSSVTNAFDNMINRFPTATHQFIENLLLSVLTREITYDKLSEYLI